MNYYSTYKDCIIYRQYNGYRLPWVSYINGMFVYADTLAGIKKLIRGQ